MKGCLACKQEQRLSGIKYIKCPVCQSEILQSAFIAIYWMARRYADGRRSYAISMCNDALKSCLDIGLPLKPEPTNGKMYAEDGDYGYPDYEK